MILLTGSNGFLGKIIRNSLNNYDVLTLSRTNAMYNVDLSVIQPHFSQSISVVIHAAGKAHLVPKTQEEAQDFFNVNVQGTMNLLKGMEASATIPKAFIFISSVAVYGLESGNEISETAPLKASDPYGKSKIDAEQLISDWCSKNNVICSILRLPLLAGTNPPGNLGAMIRGIRAGYYVNINGGKAKKSIVLAEDVAGIIPKLVSLGGIYNLTDGHHPTFYMLSKKISQQLDKPNVINIPLWIAKGIAFLGDVLGDKMPINSFKLKKITSDLTFDDSKARTVLDWNPKKVTDCFVIKNNF